MNNNGPPIPLGPSPAALCLSLGLSAGGIVLYAVAVSKDQYARMLRRAKPVELDALPGLLERQHSAEGSAYVLTSGFVRCLTGRLCDHARNQQDERLVAAIYERRLEKLMRSWTGAGWEDTFSTISFDRVETPFELVSLAETSATVNTAGASIPELKLVHQHVEGADAGILGSLASLVTQFGKSHYELGLRVSERAMSEGMPITIAAEAVTVRGGGGTDSFTTDQICLRAPSNGAPFIISIGDGADMKKAAQKKATFFYWLGGACFAAAFLTVGVSVWLSWEMESRRKQLEAEAEANRARSLELMTRMGRETAYSEDLKIEELLLCVVCMEKPISTVFLDCGHMLCCEICSGRTKSKNGTCPVCRKAIRRVKNVFLP